MGTSDTNHWSRRLQDGKPVRLFGSVLYLGIMALWTVMTTLLVADVITKMVSKLGSGLDPPHDTLGLSIGAAVMLPVTLLLWSNLLFARIQFSSEGVDMWNCLGRRRQLRYDLILARAWSFGTSGGDDIGAYEIKVCVARAPGEGDPRWKWLGNDGVWRRGLTEATRNEIVRRADLAEAPAMAQAYSGGIGKMRVWAVVGQRRNDIPALYG